MFMKITTNQARTPEQIKKVIEHRCHIEIFIKDRSEVSGGIGPNTRVVQEGGAYASLTTLEDLRSFIISMESNGFAHPEGVTLTGVSKGITDPDQQFGIDINLGDEDMT